MHFLWTSWLRRAVRAGLAVCASLCLAGLAAGAQVVASLDRDTLAVGETATLRIVVDDVEPQSVAGFGSLPGLTITYLGPAQQRVQVGAQVQLRTTLNFAVRAALEGQHTIPGVVVKAGGREYRTQPLTLQVGPARPAPANPEQAFLELSVPREEFYVGELFPLQVHLYFQNAANVELPVVKADGFTLNPQPEQAQDRVRIGNAQYAKYLFRYATRAVKTGDLELGPAESNMELRVRVREQDDPFGGFLSAFRSQPFKARSETKKVRVLPLPEAGRPAGFNGAVGEFTLNVSGGKPEVDVGDPLMLTVEIAGAGNFDSVHAPDWQEWRDFKVYPPNAQFTAGDALGIRGTKRFEIVVVPQNAEVKTIPEIRFSYFDPRQRRYQTLTRPPQPLVVRPLRATVAQPTVVAVQTERDPAGPPAELAHIKPHLGLLVADARPWVLRPWFWAAQLFPLLAWLTVLGWRRRQERLAADPRRSRRVAVDREEAGGMLELRAAAEAADAARFFDLLLRLLQARLGERLALPASAITEAVVDERLRERGASDDLCATLHALFQCCNQARYAPQSDRLELAELADQAESVLRELAGREWS